MAPVEDNALTRQGGRQARARRSGGQSGAHGSGAYPIVRSCGPYRPAVGCAPVAPSHRRTVAPSRAGAWDEPYHSPSRNRPGRRRRPHLGRVRRGQPGRRRGERLEAAYRLDRRHAARPDGATKKIIDEFTEKTGIKVELVGVDEDQFNQLITSAAAAGELPDVIGAQPLAVGAHAVGQRAARHRRRPARWSTRSGADTFDQRALELDPATATRSSRCPATPGRSCSSTARTCSTRPGCAAPTPTRRILAAARTLNTAAWPASPAATAAGDAFTQQTFEHVALANGCQLVDDAGDDHPRPPAVRRRLRLLRRPGHELLGPRHPGRRHHPGHLLRRPGRDDGLVARSSSTSWPGCATTRCPAAPSARQTRGSWRRTPGSSPR